MEEHPSIASSAEYGLGLKPGAQTEQRLDLGIRGY